MASSTASRSKRGKAWNKNSRCSACSNIMQETEAKFYVRNLKRVELRLQDMGAHLIQDRVLETNIRFDLPDGGLRSEGRVLRLRQDTEARLTYKSASTNEQGVLSRTEIEFAVEDHDKARQFLEALGYRKLVYYEKYRMTYELRQTSGVLTHVMLDELPYGNFVEIEGESVESIRAVAKALQLNWEAAVPTSYHALFERLRRTYPDLDPKELSFAALNGLDITTEDLSIRAADD
ncbi:MAG: class IV adenylate cyclase [Anaerolineales bacterium]|nr:MAG: class IV adenylate cyclase [Anaerolineales bacterium]